MGCSMREMILILHAMSNNRFFFLFLKLFHMRQWWGGEEKPVLFFNPHCEHFLLYMGIHSLFSSWKVLQYFVLVEATWGWRSTWKSPGTNLWVPPFRADFVMVGNSILQCSEPACARRRHFLQPARLFTLLLGALAEPRRAACTYLWLGKKTFSRIPANHQAAVLPARVRELQWSSRSLQVSKSKSLSSERWVTSLGACIWLLWDCGSRSKL